MQNYEIEDVSKAFVRVLCSTGISETAIHGIAEMSWNNKAAMDKVVHFIEENPKATEAEITKAASQAIGL